MRVLLTGASSFTGFWFAKALLEADIEVVAPLRGSPASYSGVRAERVALLIRWAKVVPLCPFGGDAFFDLVRSQEFDALCHHAAEVRDYRSADFDVMGAVSANTANFRQTLETMRARGLRAVVATGSVFEPDEGAGPNPRRAFSPYGLSKGLTWQVIKHWCETLEVPLGKFVIANPFGPLEEPRFVSYVVQRWSKGEAAEVRTPAYLRDNIHVELLARTYARFLAETVKTGESRRFGPCGYLETQGAFAQRLACELAPRLGCEGRVELGVQTDFSEPLARVNCDQINPNEYEWNEAAAWDLLADYWRGRGFAAAPAAAPAEIWGAVDAAGQTHVSGWLSDKRGDNPRFVRVLVDEAEQGAVRADTFRPDLKDKQISDGYSGYRFAFSRPLDPYSNHTLRLEDRDSGTPFGPASIGIERLVGGASSPFVCDRDFVAANVAGATFGLDFVDVLLELFGPVVRFAPPASRNATLEVLEAKAYSHPYFETLGVDASRVRLRARKFDPSSPIDLGFAEAAALSAPDQILCRNIVPARLPEHFRDVARENIERVAGPGEDIARFAATGMATAFRIEGLVRHHFGRSLRECGRVLDWGAGPGRVALPLARDIAPGITLTAADVDGFNVAFGQRHFRDVEFVTAPFLPPLPFADATFGAVYGVSVFTHLTESVQFAWLKELRRLVRPGAPVIVSVHSEFQLFRVAAARPDVLAEAMRRGISDALGDDNLGPKLAEKNYYRSTFHSRRYILDHWTPNFEVVKIYTAANGGAQDFVVLRAK